MIGYARTGAAQSVTEAEYEQLASYTVLEDDWPEEGEAAVRRRMAEALSDLCGLEIVQVADLVFAASKTFRKRVIER